MVPKLVRDRQTPETRFALGFPAISSSGTPSSFTGYKRQATRGAQGTASPGAPIGQHSVGIGAKLVGK
jgi:hypothetical protein